MRIPAITIALAALQAWNATPVAAQATGTSTVDKVAQYATDKLKTDLDLTADQIPKVQKINVAAAKSMQQLLDKYDKDTSAKADVALVRGLVAAQRQNQMELKKVLTPAQWTLNQQHKAERLAMSQTEYMASDLDLSKDQILTVAQINLDGANNLVKAFDKQPSNATRQQLVNAAKPVVAARDSALEKVLTVDQWKAMQKNRSVLRDVLLQEATGPAPSAAAAAPKPKP